MYTRTKTTIFAISKDLDFNKTQNEKKVFWNLIPKDLKSAMASFFLVICENANKIFFGEISQIHTKLPLM